MADRRFQVVDATPELMAAVAADVRQADVDELWAAAKMTPEEALRQGSKWSSAFVALDEGRPICAFGVVPYSVLTKFGAPWMVGTNALDRSSRQFIRQCRTDLSGFFGEWDKLLNVVDARNTTAIRWLKWLGFTVFPAVPYGPLGMPFHLFLMEVDHV